MILVSLMNYISVKQAAEKWNMSSRRVQTLCSQNRIEGAQRVGNVWTIPESAEKPDDARLKQNKEKKLENQSIKIERIWAMPNSHTFEIKPIADLIESELTDGTWIDPFANRNKYANITNDLSDEFDTDYHMDALDFMKMFDNESIDGVLYDPPYSPRQVSECYNNVGYNVTWHTTKASFWGNHKKEISRITKVGGKVITFGWNSGGIGAKYGFTIQRILLVPHGGWHNDTICTVEVKTHHVDLNSEKEKNKITMDNKARNLNDEQLIQMLRELPDDYWDFKNSDTQEYTHGLHSYPAVMVCPISRNIIRIMKKIKNVDALFDPFAGSGTVLVEGKIAGIKKVSGNDINPLALFLEKVKTTNIDISILQNEASILIKNINDSYNRYKNEIDSANEYISNVLNFDLTTKDGWGIDAHNILTKYCIDNHIDLQVPDFKNIGYWFKPKVILLLQIIKNEIEKTSGAVKDFLYISFSEIIRLVSNRRNGEFKMFRMKPEKVAKFEPDVIKEFEKQVNKNISNMNDFNEVCLENGTTSEVRIFSNNATLLNDVEDEAYDLIITSPPYGDSKTTVAYGEYSKLSLQWMNITDLTEKEIVGIDKNLLGGKKYRSGFEYNLNSITLRDSLEKIMNVDMERAGDVFSFYSELDASIAAISRKTKKDGYQFWVVGNRTVKNELLLTDKIIEELADSHDLDYVYTIDRNIVNKVMPSLNSPTNEAGQKVTKMTNEHIVILRKR